MNVLDELKERGYFEQATYEDELRELLENEKVKFYIGFDATADSLTIGHFIQIMVMMRMQKHGHIPIVIRSTFRRWRPWSPAAAVWVRRRVLPCCASWCTN